MSADGWRLSLGTLTRIPAGAISAVTPPVARTAMLAGPWMVLPIALVAALVGWAAVALGGPDLVGGLLVVGMMAQLTRAMHWDGLADTADGLGASWDRDRALAVMRTGDVGPMGAGTLVVVLGLQAVAYGDLLTRPWGWLLVTALVAASRTALAVCCLRGVRAARPEGLGHAVAGSVPVAGAVLSWLVWGGLLAGAGLLAGCAWWAGMVAGLGGLFSAGLLLAWCLHRLGGITGDVLGACIETAATGLAVVAVVAC